MIEISDTNLDFFEDNFWATTGELINPCLNLEGDDYIDKAFLNHLKREVKRYNEKMHENEIKRIIKKAEKEQRESFINMPLSIHIFNKLKEEDYLRTYEEWENG